jgi:hypothetical protein
LYKPQPNNPETTTIPKMIIKLVMSIFQNAEYKALNTQFKSSKEPTSGFWLIIPVEPRYRKR